MLAKREQTKTEQKEEKKLSPQAQIALIAGDIALDGIITGIKYSITSGIGAYILSLAINEYSSHEAAQVGLLAGAFFGVAENIGTRALTHFGVFKQVPVADEKQEEKSVSAKLKERVTGRIVPAQTAEEKAQGRSELIMQIGKNLVKNFTLDTAQLALWTFASYEALSKFMSMSPGQHEASAVTGYAVSYWTLVIVIGAGVYCLSDAPEENKEQNHKQPRPRV